MDFGTILKLLNNGTRAYRKGWNGIEAGIDMYVYLARKPMVRHEKIVNQVPRMQQYEEAFNMEPFYIFYHKEKKTSNAWMPSVWDINADDWEIWVDPRL